MPYATVNGVRLNYELHGESGEPLVFVHGYTGDITDCFKTDGKVLVFPGWLEVYGRQPGVAAGRAVTHHPRDGTPFATDAARKTEVASGDRGLGNRLTCQVPL